MTRYLILSLATLLVLFLSPPTTIASATNTNKVYDIDGNPLEAGSNYYILPVIRGQGGGLTLSSKNATQPCPLYVTQDQLEVSKGLPIKFYPVDPRDQIISLSADLNFVFDAASICVQSTGWSLTMDDEETGRSYVGTGGVIGNPGMSTVFNWFSIEKAGSGNYDYKIVFCPGVCELCRVRCGEVGVFVDKDGKRLLGLSDVPLLVTFKKEDQNGYTYI